MSIKLFALDVDGTLTDGKIYIGNEGELFKSFHVKDGMAIKLLKEYGILVAIVTGRSSEIVTKRAKELGIEYVFQNIEDKAKLLKNLTNSLSISLKETAYVGDDINDLKVLQIVGYPFALRNSEPELKEISLYVTETEGGNGAIREIVNKIVKGEFD